jgi:hypothetical protein
MMGHKPLRAGKAKHFRGHGDTVQLRELVACGDCGGVMHNTGQHADFFARTTPLMLPRMLPLFRLRDWHSNELKAWTCTTGRGCGGLIVDRRVHADWHTRRGLLELADFAEVTHSIAMVPLMKCGDCGLIMVERMLHDLSHTSIDPKGLYAFGGGRSMAHDG